MVMVNDNFQVAETLKQVPRTENVQKPMKKIMKPKEKSNNMKRNLYVVDMKTYGSSAVSHVR